MSIEYKEKLPIALVIFSCTVEKLGRRDYYQICINNLAQNIDLDLFPYKLLAVKFRPNERDIAESYKVWAENKGFEVMLNEGNWVNGEISKTKEYLSDYIKIFHLDYLNQFPFVFEVEDDVTLEVKSGKLIDYLNKSAQILVENKGILACRATDRDDEFDRINRLNAKYGWTHKKAIRIEGLTDYFLDSDHLTYRNYVARTRDMFMATRIIWHNFDKIHPSAETNMTNALLALTDYKTPFLCWNPGLIKHKHMWIPNEVV